MSDKNDNLRLLVELQQRDIRISRLRKAIDEIPGRIEASKQGLFKVKEELKNLQEEMAGYEKQRQSLERTVENNKEALVKSRQKLAEVKTNKEYTAILLEIENIEKAIYNTEDEILNNMELMEQSAAQEKDKKREAIKEEELFNRLKEEKERELSALNRELEKETAERAGLIAGLEKPLVESYERLRQVRNGLAVVSVEDNTCQGCNMTLPPQVVAEAMKGEELTRCEHCDRILFVAH